MAIRPMLSSLSMAAWRHSLAVLARGASKKGASAGVSILCFMWFNPPVARRPCAGLRYEAAVR
jgi:hypothetical protein